MRVPVMNSAAVNRSLMHAKRTRGVIAVPIAIAILSAMAALAPSGAGENQTIGETPAAPGATPSIAPSGGITPGTGPNAVVPPIVPATPVIAAKTLFGAAKAPAPLQARAIGYYSRGCLAGAQQLPIDGPEWQAMRLSRNRNWGHPALISFLERFAADARSLDAWPGLLVGDMSQPRGGPMLTGHASHQVGLDADIWLTPMPGRRLSPQEREETSAVSMLAPGNLAVSPTAWTSNHVHLLKRAGSYGGVERIFVHPAIKKALCEAAAQDTDRKWLHKIRPTWGHDYHFHVRLFCPAGTPGCQPQAPPLAEDGCGKELTDWFALLTAPPKPPSPPTPPLTMDNLPPDCRAVLSAARTGEEPEKPNKK